MSLSLALEFDILVCCEVKWYHWREGNRTKMIYMWTPGNRVVWHSKLMTWSPSWCIQELINDRTRSSLSKRRGKWTLVYYQTLSINCAGLLVKCYWFKGFLICPVIKIGTYYTRTNVAPFEQYSCTHDLMSTFIHSNIYVWVLAPYYNFLISIFQMIKS